MRLPDSRVRLYLPSAEVDSDGVAAGCACLVVFLLGWRHGRWMLYLFTFLGHPHSASGSDWRPVGAICPPLCPQGTATVVIACICPRGGCPGRHGRWRNPPDVALLILAWCPTRLLPSLRLGLGTAICWITTSVHIPLGLGLGSGPCGGYLDTAAQVLCSFLVLCLCKQSAAATRRSTGTRGIECMVANTHGPLHTRAHSRQTQLE